MWQTVVDKRKSCKNKEYTSNHLTEQQVKSLLRSFKTTACTNHEFHDKRSCPHYHDKVHDGRRDPYTVEESTNPYEKMYHPCVFRTTLCDYAERSCPFGSVCARTHSLLERRNRLLEHEYLGQCHTTSPGHRLTLTSYLPEEQDYTKMALHIWKQEGLTPGTKFIHVPPHWWFLMSTSNKVLLYAQECAFEEGMCTISLCDKRQGLIAKGIHLAEVTMRVNNLFLGPNKHFVIQRKKYNKRVLQLIQNGLKNGNHPEFSSPRAYLDVELNKSSLRVAAVESHGESALRTADRVFEMVNFWIRTKGYNQTWTCGCCLEERVSGEGLVCPNGHFFCSVGPEEEQCFASAVRSQVNQIRSRKHAVECSQCGAPYDNQVVARHLPLVIWDTVLNAVVSKQVEELQRQFDERLRKKMEEFMANYGNASTALQLKAQSEAKFIRNNVLNLCCPHCKIAYIEFEGCMALKCSSCSGNFCGYCHAKVETSQGAHEHVRQCLMNITPTSSYYANKNQIQEAQKQYRTRTLKKHLRSQKKDLQNAIIIELKQDLDDLGIRPEALFEFGNLHGEVF